MKIGFLLPADILSGGVFVVLEHASRLVPLGHDVRIIFKNTSPSSEDRPSALEGFDLTSVSWDEALLNSFDVIVASWWETAIDMLSLKSTSYSYFVQSDERRFYGSPESPEASLIELTYSLPVHFITEAKWIAALLREEFNQEASVAPNGVSRDLFYPRVREDRPATTFRVLVEGASWVPYKRVALALQAARAVEGAEIWYVSPDGHVPDELPYDRLFRSVPRNEMPKIYSECDVLLKLSTVEGFFCPPLEMMACGGTVVVSAVTGYDEFVVHEKNGLVVALDDKDGASAALRRLRDDPELLQRLRSDGLATAEAMSWEPSTAIFERFLERALDELPAKSPLLAVAKFLHRQRETIRKCSLDLDEYARGMTHQLSLLPDQFYTRREAESLPVRLESSFGEKIDPLAQKLQGQFDRVTEFRNDFDEFVSTVRVRFDQVTENTHTRREAEQHHYDIGLQFSALNEQLRSLEGRVTEIQSGLNVLRGQIPTSESSRGFFSRLLRRIGKVAGTTMSRYTQRAK